MGIELKGAVAIVTGASSGIGRATALALGRAGSRVALAARRKERLLAVAEELRASGAEALVVPTDVAEEAEVQALVEATTARWGRVDILMANAGVGLLARVAETSREEFERLMAVNFFGAVYGILAVLPLMRRQGSGHIVTVASVVGKRATPYRAAYAASKFALVGLSEALRMELRGTGIHVTCVCPVGTESEFHEKEPTRLGIPARRGPVQSPEHVADRILRALRRPRPEVHPFPPARLLFLANAVAPGLVDRLLIALSPKAPR